MTPRQLAATRKRLNERACWLIVIGLGLSARYGPMKHQGVRYTIRAGIERDLWSVAIHPGGTESRAKLIYGTREDAEFEARCMIANWAQGKPIARRRQSRRKTAGNAERK